MAEVAAEAASQRGAEVRLRRCRETAPESVVKSQAAWAATAARTAHIPEAQAEDMEWANAYLFSAPTRYGGAASQMRAFIDTLGPLWLAGKLANKPVTAMSSAQNPHGGQESTILTMYYTFMHWGSIIVPPGYTDPVVFGAGGNPYGTSFSAKGEPLDEATKAAIRHQTVRLIETAEKLLR